MKRSRQVEEEEKIMDTLRQRHLKLLYRQRGSASRTIDCDVVIENDAISEGEERSRDFAHDMGEISVDGGMPDDQDGVAYDEGHMEEYDENKKEEQQEVEEYEAEAEEKGEKPDFSGFSMTKLSTPITSMATIDVLEKLLEIVVVEGVIKEKRIKFRGSLSRPRKLRLKLEIRIYEQMLRRCQEDFRTISDYNLSNNDLIYRSKQISAMKQSLGESLLEIRGKTHELNRDADVVKEVSAFENLKRINDMIIAQEAGSVHQYKRLNPQLLDSNSGLLARLQNLNQSLSEI